MEFTMLADAVARQIVAGDLPPGTRLPTHRAFARRHGVAASTATRVYQELTRRGLIVGEVGRGTFVRAMRPTADPVLAEPTGLRVDLELNFPVQPEQRARLASSMAEFLRTGGAAAALGPWAGPPGTAAVRTADAPGARPAGPSGNAADVLASLLVRPGWRPERIVLTGSGRQAIAAALATCARPGDRLGVEPLTYPVVKAVGARLGLTLVPLDLDDDGIIPERLRATHRRTPLTAVYLQPGLHNPLGISVPPDRRAALAEVLEACGVTVIEDAVYSFLTEPAPPLTDRSLVVDSLSKRVAPGLAVGMIACSAAEERQVSAAVRSGAWTPSAFAAEVAAHWVRDGTVAAIVAEKRADARERHALARTVLAGFDVIGDQRSYHCWWRLPARWRAETFVAAAARHGIAVTPGAAYAVQHNSTPNAVRLALSAPPVDVLAAALHTLRTIAEGTPDDEFA
ncbi:aminotransferase-like domain-containing protein [Virgisporangium ochraceum]|uniref:GntR family transcriptional regulator n=1 Tax=Virgisporangium ochraceum TaxID=65505 RepID=A0A8J4E910_9ACTN|nr:PLP-dependent aminotransferase family protein [Virgisporangium ochraceum]GIJ65818.1 GntR family transcriptional regulator [Virgisporangium ochraceum]